MSSFSAALEGLREGRRYARAGWNGKDMFVVLQPGYPEGVPANANTAASFNLAEGTVVVVRPYLAMWTADGQIVPWVVSQSDLLVDDWQEV